MDYSPPGSSVHGVLQARILEWVAISFSRRSSRPICKLASWICLGLLSAQSVLRELACDYLYDLPWSSHYGHQTIPCWMWWHRRLFQSRSKADAIFCLLIHGNMEHEYHFNKENYWLHKAKWCLLEKHQIHCTITTLFVTVWSDSTFFSPSFAQQIFIEWVVYGRHCTTPHGWNIWDPVPRSSETGQKTCMQMHGSHQRTVGALGKTETKNFRITQNPNLLYLVSTLTITLANDCTLATSCEELTHWKRLWCWEGLGAGGEGDNRGWNGWMASPTPWTWVWVNSGSWWWTGRPGVLRFMGSQRVGHNWATELNWTEWLLNWRMDMIS